LQVRILRTNGFGVNPEDQWKQWDVCCPAILDDDVSDNNDVNSVASDGSQVTIASTTNNSATTAATVTIMVTPDSPVATVNVTLQDTLPGI
jgi:hypothetical protein